MSYHKESITVLITTDKLIICNTISLHIYAINEVISVIRLLSKPEPNLFQDVELIPNSIRLT